MPPVGFLPKISAGVVVCDLETSRMGAPYIYDISRLRVNLNITEITEWKRAFYEMKDGRAHSISKYRVTRVFLDVISSLQERIL